MKLRNLILFLLSVFGAWTHAADSRPVVRLPKMPQAPVIDGVVRSAEWLGATTQWGTLAYNSDNLADRHATYFLGRDNENIYFACRSELPPYGQKILARVKKTSELICMDDCVEFHIMPPHGKFTYQFIMNARDAKYTAKYAIVHGDIATSPILYEPKDLMIANTQQDGHWTMEMRLPIRELEYEQTDPSDRPWGVQMARCWHNPDDFSHWSKTRFFSFPNFMGQVYWDDEAPATDFLGLGENFAKGEYSIQYRVANTTKSAKTIRCDISVKSTAVPRILHEEVLVPPGGTHTFHLDYIEKAPFTFDFAGELTEVNRNVLLQKRIFSFQKPKENRWIFTQRKSSADLEIGFYPYHQLVKARFGNLEFPVDAAVSNVSFTLFGPDGKQIGTEHHGKLDRRGFAAQWKVGTLPEGTHSIVAAITRQDGSRENRSGKFLNKHFAWEHNNLGKERIIIPPFQPLQVNESRRTIQALQTGYQAAANGFWNAVFSQGKDILAAPIALSVNGDRDFFQETAFAFTECSTDRVATNSQLQGSGLKMNVQNEYDYDGLCKTTLEFLPERPFKATDFTLEIPLKGEIAQMYHCVNDVPRYHPTDFLPKGEGCLWDSTRGRKHPQVHGNFWPYVWIGEQYKGICWFAPNDKDWQLDAAKPALEIVRAHDQTVTLRVHLVNTPVELQKPLRMVLGFQPTPAKPLPKDWRRLYDRGRPAAHAISTTVFSPYSYGSPRWWNPFPVDEDYTIIQRLSPKNRLDPIHGLTKEVIEDFFHRHESKIKELTRGSSYGDKEVFHSHLYRAQGYTRAADLFTPYLNPRSADSQWESYQVFQNEWFYTENRANIDYDEYNIEASESYQDMFLWYAKKQLENGMDGLYYDNVRIRATFDPVRGPAYALPDQTIQPFFDFFSFRQFLKRSATMVYQEKKLLLGERPYIVLHMTNGAIMPFLSFGAIQLDLESELGPKEFHDRFSEGYYRTETLGTQSGCIPQIINYITGNNQKWVCRTFVTIQLAMDLPYVMWGKNFDPIVTETWKRLYTFGYGTEQCQVIPSWKGKEVPADCDQADVRISAYVRKDRQEAILALCDLGNADKEFTVDFSRLSFRNCQVTELESNQVVVPSVKHSFRIQLPRRDFRLIHIMEK